MTNEKDIAAWRELSDSHQLGYVMALVAVRNLLKDVDELKTALDRISQCRQCDVGAKLLELRKVNIP